MMKELLYFYFLGKFKLDFEYFVNIPEDRKKSISKFQKISPLISIGITSILISYWWRVNLLVWVKLLGALVIIVVTHSILIKYVYDYLINSMKEKR